MSDVTKWLDPIRDALSDNQQTIRALDYLHDDLQGTETLLTNIKSQNAPEMSSDIEALIEAGGKRLRPALVLLSHRLLQGEHPSIHTCAMGVELTHTATLIHDDIMDDDEQRRGVQAVHQASGHFRAITSGNYLFAAVMSAMLKQDLHTQARELADRMIDVTEGQYIEEANNKNIELSEKRYRTIIDLKTASLFEYAAWCGAYTADASTDDTDRLARFGRSLGRAFQIIDDLIDFQDPDETGKPALSDVREGTMSLQRVHFDPEQFARLGNFPLPPSNYTIEAVRETIAPND